MKNVVHNETNGGNRKYDADGAEAVYVVGVSLSVHVLFHGTLFFKVILPFIFWPPDIPYRACSPSSLSVRLYNAEERIGYRKK